MENIIINEEVKKNNKNKNKSGWLIDLIKDLNLLGSFCWIAPIRAKPRRVYDNDNHRISPEGEHTPYILKSILSSKKYKDSSQRRLDSFGTQSGLFDTVRIGNFGRENTSPFELNIVINEESYKIPNVGYGISQVLPITIELIGRSKGTLFAIQQPEVHLHPKAQAVLGEFIYKIGIEENKNFLIETHSEYLVNRFRFNLHQNKNIDENIDSQVLFFERTDHGNEVHVININNDGKYSADQSHLDDFHEFFIDEELNLLEI